MEKESEKIRRLSNTRSSSLRENEFLIWEETADWKTMRRKLVEYRRCYLGMAKFTEDLSDIFTPHLLFDIVTQTLYCVANLYLALMYLSVTDNSTLIVMHFGLFAQNTLRLLVVSCVGHSMSAQVRTVSLIYTYPP